MTDEKTRRLPQTVAFVIALLSLNLALICSACAGGALFFISFVQFRKALISSLPVASEHLGSAESLHDAIKGVEYLFLAPLPFLVVWGLLKYVDALKPIHLTRLNEDERMELQVRARGELVFLKAFTVSLFIAAIGASLVGKALSVEGLTFEATFCSVLAIGGLAGYYYILELSARHSAPKV